jgi:transcription-repair coupling factor (superfamily II helicase)
MKDLAAGTVDVAIGTHRLLQKDVVFHDLGLLIVDEEQRFGVTHKERLKEIAKQVDVLTLSATPIPRTLNMALSGIRDMSTIEEPPRDRQPVQTYVLEHDWSVLADAMRREVSRGGQVYYLHNRVETIARTAARLSDLLDGSNVAVAHGQMDEDSLGEIMEQMAAGEIQVLVCTTIIESGIDIPNVNTLIIEDADRLGLSQLHQIRGRVGRSSRRAFAYLTFRRGKILTEVATKRLSAIREFAEFNSGFKIALRDLEIRGAGNVLGSEQSGHMMSVGYDLYLKLLEEAVLEEKREKPTRRADCTADIAVTAYIPEKYVPSGEQRMDLYRRIARIRTEEDADDLVSELVDRYGDPPKSVNALVSIAQLRGEAAEAGIEEISQKAGYLKLQLTEFEMERISALYSMPAYKGRLKVEAGTVPVISVKLRSGIGVIEEARRLVRDYRLSI